MPRVRQLSDEEWEEIEEDQDIRSFIHTVRRTSRNPAWADRWLREEGLLPPEQ